MESKDHKSSSGDEIPERYVILAYLFTYFTRLSSYDRWQKPLDYK